MDTVTPAGQLTASPIFIPALATGEIWGGIACANGKLHHIVILAGDNDDADWNTQMAWAKERGGDLPTSLEQKVLFANAKDQFKPEWYWSGEPSAQYESYAWMQSYGNGDQDYSHKGNGYRARAVRRAPIQ